MALKKENNNLLLSQSERMLYWVQSPAINNDSIL